MSEDLKDAWNDSLGREWRTSITLEVIRRVKEDTGVNLLDFLFGMDKLAVQLQKDEILIGRVLYSVHKPQAEGKAISERSFLEGLDGQAIEDAHEVLQDALVFFCPKSKKEVAQQLRNKIRAANNAAMSMLNQKLNSRDLDRKMEQAMEELERTIDAQLRSSGSLSTRSQESSE